MSTREALEIIYGAIGTLFEFDHDRDMTKIDEALVVLEKYIKETEEK